MLDESQASSLFSCHNHFVLDRVVLVGLGWVAMTQNELVARLKVLAPELDAYSSHFGVWVLLKNGRRVRWTRAEAEERVRKIEANHE